MTAPSAQRSLYGYVIVGSAFLLVFLGIGFGVYSFSVFVEPWTREFGWSRAQVGYGQTVFLLPFFLSPLYGRLLDRYGPTKVVAPSAIVMATSLLGLGLATEVLWHFYLFHFLMGLGAAGMSGVVPASVVSRWFVARRGLALGITQVGTGTGGLVMPLVSNWILQSESLGACYAVLAAVVVAIALPLAFFTLRFPDSTAGNALETQKRSGASPEANPPYGTAGSSVGASIARSREFWFLVSALFLSSLAFNSVIAHSVPMFQDRGLASSASAQLLSVIGASSILGRLGSGYLMDKMPARYIAVLFYTAVAAGIVAFLTTPEGWILLVFAITLGMGAGAEADLVPYLAASYFGLKAHGEIYGYLYTAYVAGVTVGNAFMGFVYDLTHSYTLSLSVFVAGEVVAAALMVMLGRSRLAGER